MCFDAGRADADSNLAGKCVLGKCFNMVSHMLGAAIKLNSRGKGRQMQHGLIQHKQKKPLMNI